MPKLLQNISDKLISTPLEILVKSHNLLQPCKPYAKAELVILTCVDNRINLKLPDNFAYVIRLAGMNVDEASFSLLFLLASTKIKYVAVIQHSDCAMTKISELKNKTINGLTKKLNLTKTAAKNYVKTSFSKYRLYDSESSAILMAKKLNKSYPKVKFVPMIYKVEEKKLYFLSS